MRRRVKKAVWFFSITALLVGFFALGTALRTKNIKNPLTPIVRTVFLPAQRMISKAANRVNAFVLSISDNTDQKQENKELKEEIALLKQEIRAQTALYAENERLLALLQLKKENTSYQMVSATVVSKNTLPSSVSFCVDKGTEYGVSKNDAVLVNRALVGIVTDVGDGWAEVQTLLSSDFAAGARVVRTQENGVVRGGALSSESSCITLSFLADGASPAVGDVIETSGAGSLFPKGLLIGTVRSVSAPLYEAPSATVAPDVDFNRLYEVTIIIKET